MAKRYACKRSVLAMSFVHFYIGVIVIRLAMEAHFVHFNSKYGTIEEAQKHADGLAVVGFLLMVRTYKSRAAYVDRILLIVLDLFNINIT